MSQKQSGPVTEINVAKRETRLRGLAISEGVAQGTVCHVARHDVHSVPFYGITDAQVGDEVRRLNEAIDAAASELDQIVADVSARIGEARANIFVAQRMMLLDPIVREQMQTVIQDDHLNAETAVEQTLNTYDAMMSEVDNEYLRERGSDIGEIRRRLLNYLRGHGERNGRRLFASGDSTGQVILVAEELTPQETVGIDTDAVVGFITERGGQASHVAILARALGIPAVSGIPGVMDKLPRDATVLLNGGTGELILFPTADTLRHQSAAHGRARAELIVEPIPAFRVMANISLTSELPRVLEARADGIGLYRTEFECLSQGRMLSEEEQYERYKLLAEGLKGQPLYIRLLDLGSDKSATFLGLSTEDNPCLGLRGARLLEGRPEWFAPQARAIARASLHGPIHVVYPMVVDVDQFVRLRELFSQSTSGIAVGTLHHGPMFEVPAACLGADALLEAADFASIGTNDLIQYLLAVDRDNSAVAHDFDATHPALWAVVESLAKSARRVNKPLSLCGEVGGQTEHMPRLLQAGINTVSVSIPLISPARASALNHLSR